ncbi:hypothetical protein [Bacillus sp. 1P06AnD]|uniref:hypothetical protein n=1 Tax=Bacillus sp. 1P06AnD TaxID=3132208 RepID=UPI00399F6D1C
MDRNTLEKLAEKNKKFLEKYNIFPLALSYKKEKIHFITYYRLAKDFYSGMLFVPLDLPISDIKKVFFYFYEMNIHMNDAMKDHNTFASKDYSNGYYKYRDLLIEQLEKTGELEAVRSQMQYCVDTINRFEQYLQEIREEYIKYMDCLKKIKISPYFSTEDLDLLNDYGSNILYRMYKQGEEQVSLLEPVEAIHKKSSKLQSIREVKEIFNISGFMLDPKSVALLKHSTYGSHKRNISNLSIKDLKAYFIEREHQDLQKSFGDYFFEKILRNKGEGLE